MGSIAIVGAGPGGATLAYLLARNGVKVTLLERHRDFEREFRGEVLMPSGLEPFAQMGLWDRVEEVPHVKLGGAELYLNGRQKTRVVFDPDAFGLYAPRWISQPKLLEMLVAEAGRYDGFCLERGASVGDLLEENGRYVGVRFKSGGEDREVRADLVVGADGRGSVVRRRANLSATQDSLPMDIVWTKLPMLPKLRDDPVFCVYVGNAHLLIAAPVYDDHLQIAWIIPKGSYRDVRGSGMPACLDEMANHVSPDLADHLRRYRDEPIDPFLLSTVSDRVTQWSRPGLMVIGDAAHTMSPVGAQGLNIAIRDGVVAANHLVAVLSGDVTPAAVDSATRAIEAERLPEVRDTQRFQALPPRVLFRDTWWARSLLATLTTFAGTSFARSRAGSQFARFASGLTEVRVEV
jgi:2-polyprenyl-6-methoxyphenol hydroxylase-like FAD-dependent oxidoreductase